MNPLNSIKLGALALMWGGSFVLIELALTEFGPATLVLLRVGLAAGVLWLIVLARGHRMPSRLKDWLSYGVMSSLANVLPFLLISWGQQGTTASSASILNATVPLFVLMFGMRLGARESFSVRKLSGVILGFLGVMLLLGLNSRLSFAGGLHEWAILGAAASYAGGALYGKRFRGQSFVCNATAMLTCSTLVLFPIVVVSEDPLHFMSASASSWAAVALLGVVCTAMAYLLYFEILKSAGAIYLSLVTYLIPIVAAVGSYLVLGDVLGVREVAAMSLIFAGLTIVDSSILGKFRKRGITKGAKTRNKTSKNSACCGCRKTKCRADRVLLENSREPRIPRGELQTAISGNSLCRSRPRVSNLQGVKPNEASQH